jgi:type I restriction enzyme R subunit
MVFLVRKMRRIPDLRKFKVVIITDRKDLQKQLAETAALTNETVNEVNRVSELAPTLSRQGPELVFAMIQKYQDPDADQPKEEEEIPQFPRLNESEAILLIVDEAHRSHTNTLHLNLMDALPNAAKIGFTGTPIMRDTRKRTTKIFGGFIDTYSIKQSEEDEATVSILYEGRTARAVVSDGRTLDQLFEDMFVERTPEELEAIKQKYATTGNVLEAKELIAAKAKNILRHYVDTILPNGFKAQVVATSRAAAVRYQEALENARGQLVAQLDEFVPEKDYDAFSGNGHGADYAFLARAHKHRETIRQIEFATVISGSTNQDPKWDRWTERPKIDANIARFKKPLFHSSAEKRDNLAFLCVKSMLITGFDAPIEQALYLDRKMEGHELLQTIARVNRTHTNKSAGYIVDYVGVVNHLKEALAAYNVPDVHGAMINLKDELPKLADRHARVLAIFKERGISDIQDVDACVDLLRDNEIRADFVVKLHKFLDSLDIVMPRAEARPYLRDAKILGFINKSAENLYRDIALNIHGAGEKVRRLIDQYIVSKGIDPTVPPISILDSEFVKKVDDHKSDQAKASEMEHAARYEINERYQEDPVYYKKLSERLEEILRQFQENWEELVRALRPFVDDLRRGRPQDETGLNPRIQAPFLSVLVEEVGEEVAKPHLRKFAGYTVELVDHIRREINLLDFWRNVHSQERLLSWIVRFLDNQIDLSSLDVEFDRLPAIASRLLDLARANRSRLNL